MSSISEEAVTLVLSNHLRVAGDILEGEVNLNFRFMQYHPYQSVQVKLLGSIFTKITRTVANTDLVGEETVVLVHDKIVLWNRGEAYPPPNTDILKLPFQFTIPPHGVLPTCAFDNKLGISGKVVYWVEAIALRADVNLSRRIPKIFPVQPLDTHGAQLSQSIRLGWTGAWRQHKESKPVRKGMWGEYANITWTFTLPDMDVYPVRTPIPITLEVVTLSKPGKPDELRTKGVIFPAPPRSPHAGVELKLLRDVLIKAKQFNGVRHETLVAYLGGLAHNEDPDATVQTEIMDPVWIPDIVNEKKELGSWKQQVIFKSTMTFRCPPTFKSETMSLSYTLALKVEFPGVGNNVKSRIPIHLVSNVASSSELSVPPSWDAPPSAELELELPPAYASPHIWGGDVKEE